MVIFVVRTFFLYVCLSICLVNNLSATEFLLGLVFFSYLERTRIRICTNYNLFIISMQHD